MSDFFAALDARIARYDLLQHPFYQAWSKASSPATSCASTPRNTGIMSPPFRHT